jgi:hypothetical protein
VKLVAHDGCDTKAAGLSQRLQAGCDVHPIAMDVLTIDDDVTHVDADPKLNSPLGWYTGIAMDHSPLHFDRAAHSINNAGKLEQ